MEDEKRWYVIHTYSGYENKVKANLEHKVHSMGMENEIFNIVVPMEDEIEHQGGRKKVTKRKIFPGYALVEMIVTDRSWYVVRNTPGVTGFVGSGTKPTPLSDEEAGRILHIEESKEEATPQTIDVQVGELVRINSGAFENFPATVAEIDSERGKLKVAIDMFGRTTTAELDFNQVEKS